MTRTLRLRTTVTILMMTMTLFAHGQAENMDTLFDPHHLSAYLVAALMITVFVMIFYNRVFYYREKEVNMQAKQINTQLALVLLSNKTEVWTYDVVKRMYTLLSDQGETKKEYTPIDFSQLFYLDDFNELRKIIAAVHKGESKSDTMIVRGKAPADGKSVQHIYEINVSVLQYDRHHKPKVLLGSQRDITEQKMRQEKARNMSLRYHTVFNSSLVDMIYYDANGILSDINDKACETFGITDRETLLSRGVRINDIPAYEHLEVSQLDNIRISSITDIDKVKKEREKIPELTLKGLLYYEASVNAIRGTNGQLHGIITAGRNITEMVLSQHRQQEDSLLLQKTTKDIQAYISNINYSLKVSGVRLINYNPDTHELEISSDLSKTQYHLSQIRCASLIDVSDRRRTRGLFSRMDRRHPGVFSGTLHTLFHDKQGRDIYLTFSMVPLTGKDGSITHYFGMCRNATEMTYTEMKLREEIQKAQETEELKNTFLLNMSYEIRTPLNAVLGFAELFDGPHDEEDEQVFAEEIKRNTGELLTLINDILFISRLDARMVEFNYKECDFATLFDGYCYMGWSSLCSGVKVSVENPYNHLMVTIDDQNLGQVIQKLCTIASRMTSEGAIRAKYEYRHGELNISIEDTGKGYSQQTLGHVFDRFARDENNERMGTGLDMPIIKELVEQMGGNIEIQSEEGKGSTVYVIIPCQMSSLEKKEEIII